MSVVMVIGCGSIGSRHARLLAEMGHFVWCADADIERSKALAAEVGGAMVFPAPEMMGMTDAVFVCTWPDTHLQFARWAIEAGVPVFIEKPLALSLDGVEDLVTLAEARQVKTMVGCNWRFHPTVDLLKDQVVLGVALNVHRSPSSTHCGDAHFDTGWHCVDLLKHLGFPEASIDLAYAPDDVPERRCVLLAQESGPPLEALLYPTDEMYRRQLRHFFAEAVPMNGLREAMDTLHTLLARA